MQCEFEMVKSKRIWVPASKGRKGYFREDPREKSVLDALKGLLQRIIGLKRKGPLSDEQRAHIHKTLKQLEPKMKYFKTQRQKMEVAKVLKQIRAELQEKGVEGEKHKRLNEPKQEKSKKFNSETLGGLKRLGYSDKDIAKLSLDEGKAIYWNEIKKEE